MKSQIPRERMPRKEISDSVIEAVAQQIVFGQTWLSGEFACHSQLRNLAKMRGELDKPL